MSTFDSFNTAVKIDQLIRSRVLSVMEQERPPDRYARVASIDTTTRTAEVVYVGDPPDNAVRVPYGSVEPTGIGQEVLISGGKHNRYILSLRGRSSTDLAIESSSKESLQAASEAKDAADQAALDAGAAKSKADAAVIDAAAAKDKADTTAVIAETNSSQIESINQDLLNRALSGDVNAIRDLLAGVEGATDADIEAALNAFLTSFSALNADNLFNLLPIDLLSQIPVSLIGDGTHNLITDPIFSSPESFSGQSIWFHDETQGRVQAGSARVTADGTSKELLSNLIIVSKEQELLFGGWVKWTGLAGTGTPIQLAVTGYLPDGATTQIVIASQAATPAVSDWRRLSGSYTVPQDVTSIRLRLIMGATATAGTVWWDDLSAVKSGMLQQHLVQNLPESLGGISSDLSSALDSLIDKLGIEDFEALVNVLTGGVSTDLGDVGDRLNNFLDGLSPINGENIFGQILDDYIPGIGTINENIVTAILNIISPQQGFFGHSDVFAALKSHAQAVTDTASRLLELEKIQNGGYADGDDFERTNQSNLGPGWITYYSGGSGTIATPNGHDATFATNGVNTREFINLRTTATGGFARSQTAYQRVGVALSSASTEFFGSCGHMDLWLRVSDDTTGFANITGIRVRYGGDGTLSIDRFVAGHATRLTERTNANPIANPGPGALLYGQAGKAGTPRLFQAIIGNSVLLEIPEVGVASGLGGAYQRWGWGGRAEGHILPLPGQERPAGIRQWMGKDQLL